MRRRKTLKNRKTISKSSLKETRNRKSRSSIKEKIREEKRRSR